MSDERIDWTDLLTPAEVAKIFRVDPKTVTRWAKAGKLSAITTPGGHKRFRKSHVEEFFKEKGDPDALAQVG